MRYNTVKRGLAALLLFATVLLAILGLSSCKEQNDDELHIVVTMFPIYDWVSRILDINPSNVKLSMLMDSGKDVHSYQATVDDIATISSCDMIIYVGGESDAWVEDAIENSRNDDMVVIKLLDVVGLCYGDTCEGEDSHHDHSGDDEHIWLSVKYAIRICEYLRDRIIELDEGERDVYSSAAEKYCAELSVLDEEYEAAKASANKEALVFADRFPFIYLLADYGIEYYAAFDGCSSESDASFETVAALAGIVDELDISVVLIIDGSDGKLANTVIANTKNADQSIERLNSMQSVSKGDIESGVTYISIMRSNLESIKRALA